MSQGGGCTQQLVDGVTARLVQPRQQEPNATATTGVRGWCTAVRRSNHNSKRREQPQQQENGATQCFEGGCVSLSSSMYSTIHSSWMTTEAAKCSVTRAKGAVRDDVTTAVSAQCNRR